MKSNLKTRKKRIVLGVTGGIASGKTSVVKELVKLGAKAVYADEIAHKIIQPGTAAWKKIVLCFGNGIISPDKSIPITGGKRLPQPEGSIDRKKLAAIIFSDPAKRKMLDRITHPAIIKEIKSRIDKVSGSSGGIIAVDAPLLFEAGLESLFDKILVVWVPEKLQLERLMDRNKLPYADALRRIRTQMPLSRKINLADYAIDNSGKPAGVKSEVRRIFNLLLTNKGNIL